jgi:hypothetical protein
MLAAGEELAEAASQALGVDMQFEDISEYVHLHSQNIALTPCKPAYTSYTCADDIFRAEAKRVLHAQAPSDASEIQYLLEYYSLVREGKTNYISTCAFHDITGQHPQEPVDFFKVYAAEFKPEHASKKRKTNGK